MTILFVPMARCLCAVRPQPHMSASFFWMINMLLSSFFTNFDYWRSRVTIIGFFPNVPIFQWDLSSDMAVKTAKVHKHNPVVLERNPQKRLFEGHYPHISDVLYHPDCQIILLLLSKLADGVLLISCLALEWWSSSHHRRRLLLYATPRGIIGFCLVGGKTLGSLWNRPLWERPTKKSVF